MKGEAEKKAIALSSVFAGAALTGGKLVAGLLTGSLGILSEAAHSALDLCAAVITWFAVRTAGKPADAEHHYGHGKVENLSALVETLLLLLTAGWVISEAVHRLTRGEVEVEVTRWAFAVMAGSILIDASRSRALLRTARKYSSQALEADALHFRTDIWSSVVVIVGLLCVALANRLQVPALKLADPVAALGVSAVIVWVSVALGRRTIDALVDRAPEGLARDVERAVGGLPGVHEVRHVRLRTSGQTIFVDVRLALDGQTSLRDAEGTIKLATERVAAIMPYAEVTIHVAPDLERAEEASEAIRRIARQQSAAAHHIAVFEADDGLHIECHVEVPGDLTLFEGHEAVTAIEERIRAEVPLVAEVNSHLESQPPRRWTWRPAAPESAEERALKDAASAFPEVLDCHGLRVWTGTGGVAASCHLTFDGSLRVAAVHEIAHRVEQSFRRAVPALERVTIHCEPAALQPGAAARAAENGDGNDGSGG